ncbi:recQ-mediated genome instability protein 1 isoform 1-T2 [Polymixia lowei]
MAPQTQGVVCATQAWLQSSWHVQVPFAWLEACVEWLQEEGGGGGCLSQQHINQQVLDQWLLTDLRDLGHPVLPDGLSQAQKTELSGTFCVQVDSLLDISQPAYGQLQKWRGADCINEEVSAVTQTTQKPWEARPTRMLLLQVTDGVQSLEAMEYQPIPALSTTLRPGVKLQLLGQMVCRLGVLLLGPANIKVLGGEVEDMVDRNNQGRVLCRTLGLPEEEQQTGTGEQEDANQGTGDDLEVDDQELLASLEAQEEVERESGYGTLGEASVRSGRSSSVMSHASTTSSRPEASTPSYRSGLVQGQRWASEIEDSALVAPSSSSHLTQHEVTDYNTADDNFPDEDFDDLPLDELDSIIFQESVTPQSDSIQRRITGKPQTLIGSRSQLVTGNSGNFTRQDEDGDSQSRTRPGRGQLEAMTSKPSLPSASPPLHEDVHFLNDDERDFMDEDMPSCFPEEIETYRMQAGFDNRQITTQETDETLRAGGLNGLPLDNVHQRPQGFCQSGEGKERVASKTAPSGSNYGLNIQSSRREVDTSIKKGPALDSPCNIPQGLSYTSRAAESGRISLKKEPKHNSTVPALTLTSPPFTYLCLVQDLISQPQPNATVIHVKAFIVTLLGKLTSNNGAWRICATICDGTSYLDVELSDEVLVRLLGFSVGEKQAMKRDPARRAELDAGMKRCQEELVDMCCVMTIKVEPQGRKSVVTRVDPVTEKDLQALEQRVRDRRT